MSQELCEEQVDLVANPAALQVNYSVEDGFGVLGERVVRGIHEVKVLERDMLQVVTLKGRDSGEGVGPSRTLLQRLPD
jgi:hypothetical protein